MVVACGESGSPAPTPSPTPRPASSTPRPQPSSTSEPPQPTSTPEPPATPTVASPAINPTLPVGYPLNPETRTDLVVGAVGSRTIAPEQGATVRIVSETQQVSDDPVVANQSGWDCRTHVEYEGTPAVDWYVQPGTPVRATMDGTAILIINTHANAFDYYGVSREPYLGDPDRTRAPLSPFPGPGGGMGVYAAVINDHYRTDYGHFSLARTIANVPAGAFIGGYSRDFDYQSTFAVPRDYRTGEQVATWQVHPGDVIGYTGDSGYSEAPHLHYTITDRATGARLCPTSEPGFPNNGWLSG